MTGSRLPNEYQEVEYIQTTGTQWINTGVAPSNDIRIKTDIEVSQTGQDKAVFGLYVIGTEGTSISNAYHLTPYSSKWYYGTNRGQGNAGTYSPVVGTRYNIDFNCDSHGHILINGQNITAYDETYGGGSYSNPIIGISWRGYSAGATRKGQFKYYSFKMLNKNTNQYIRNFIPCYRKSDNVIGMYDLITKTFYENAGTGTFLKGNDINTYNNLSENDKLWNNNGTWQLNETAITDNYLLEQLQALENIELYENLCYVDWVGNTQAPMTLKYNIDVVSGDNNIVVSNKNLFVATDVFNGYITGNGALVSNVNNRTVILRAKPNTTYTIQAKRMGQVGSDDFILSTDSNYPSVGSTTALRIFTTTDSEIERTFTTRATDNWIAFKVANVNNSNYEETLATIQLEEGNQATDYTEHQGSSYRVDLRRKE